MYILQIKSIFCSLSLPIHACLPFSVGASVGVVLVGPPDCASEKSTRTNNKNVWRTQTSHKDRGIISKNIPTMLLLTQTEAKEGKK